MPEREPVDYGVWGDTPPDPENLAGTISLDHVPDPNKLRKVAREHLKANPGILAWAKSAGKDLVALSTSHGKEIVAGVGVAAIVGAIGGVVLYRHTHHKD